MVGYGYSPPIQANGLGFAKIELLIYQYTVRNMRDLSKKVKYILNWISIWVINNPSNDVKKTTNSN